MIVRWAVKLIYPVVISLLSILLLSMSLLSISLRRVFLYVEVG